MPKVEEVLLVKKVIIRRQRMRGWICYNRQDAIRNSRYIDFHIKEGKKLGMEIELIYIEELSFGVTSKGLYVTYEGKEVTHPDFAIVRMNYPLLSRQLEQMNIPVYNNSKVAAICNDKALTYQYVASSGVSMVPSRFVHRLFLDSLESEQRPFVVKSVSGHGGSQVFLVTEDTTKEELEGIKEKLSDHVVVQPLIKGKGQDLRVYVIGNKVIGAVLRTAKEGFKSNFSLGGNARFYELNQQEKETVDKILSLFEFDLVGIDFIIDEEGNLIFNEIEDVVGSRMLYSCSDINIVALYLAYIKKDLHKML